MFVQRRCVDDGGAVLCARGHMMGGFCVSVMVLLGGCWNGYAKQ
jgi:glycine cleavage system regulatory protein